jgi:hypothetical protein
MSKNLVELMAKVIKYPVKFEKGCGMFFDADDKHFADVRGWGYIQYLKVDGVKPEELQDELGLFIQNAINEKLTSLCVIARTEGDV